MPGPGFFLMLSIAFGFAKLRMSGMAGDIERELIGGMTRSGKYPRVIRSSTEGAGIPVEVAIGFYADDDTRMTLPRLCYRHQSPET